MTQYRLKDDYSEGCHPAILEALAASNMDQEIGYGEDRHCIKAANLIREKIDRHESDIHFVSGGTQANLIVISALLRPHQSVIAPESGHIAVHETGAIESIGHKINTIKTVDGKLTPDLIQGVIDQHDDEHMVQPKMVFISNATEMGTIYTRQELIALSICCRTNDLILYLDGARLGAALTVKRGDLTLPEIAKMVDVFYIGGTKNGALLGEAIVINDDQLKQCFRFHMKQRGGMLAKGRLLGIQFCTLFEDDLFFKLGDRANRMAARIAKAIRILGYPFLTQPISNQIFPIFPDRVIEQLEKKYTFHIWKRVDETHLGVRLVTSWATSKELTDHFISDLKDAGQK